jgi:excisionase family DNA binding protein
MEIIMTARIANKDAVKELNGIVALKQVYDIPDLLTIVPIGRSKLYDEINANRLHATKIGRRTLFLLKDVLAWLEAAK